MKDDFKKFNWLKVLLATVTAIALTLLYCLAYKPNADNSFQSLLQNLIPNLIAVLIGVPIIYFIFTKIGLSPEEELRQGIVEDINKLNIHQSGFEDHDLVNQRFDFKEKLKSAETIDIVALSALNIISAYRTQLVEAIQHNCKVRIIIVDPKSEAARVVMSNQRHNELIPDVERLIERMKTTIEEAGIVKHTGNVEIRGINWIPSCSFVIYNREKIDCEIRIKVYPVMIDIPISSITSNTIVFKRYEPRIAGYFLNNYEELWKRSTLIDKTNM
jgi:hypothetical protein